VLARHFVVVGESPQLDAAGVGAGGDHLGLESAVGDGGMAVEVGVQRGVGHTQL